MSVWLYRLGRFAYRRPWRVIGAWLTVLGVLGGLLIANPTQLTNELRIDGTPAQNVIDELAERMPEAAGGQGVLAFRVEHGRVDEAGRAPALLAAVDAVYRHDHVVDAREVLAAEAVKGDRSVLLRASAAIPHGGPTPLMADGQTVPGAVPPGSPTQLTANGTPVPGVLVSADGTVALLQFQFDEQTHSLPSGTIEDTVAAAEQAVEGTGIEVLPGAAMSEMPELVGIGELIGVGVAAIVLLITLGSVVAAGLPLVIAISGVAVGVGGAFTLSHLVDMQSITVVLALMLGLAVGIDYGLFLINRARRFMSEDDLAPEEAAARATGTAGSAVFFAGLTVVIALLGLTVARIQLLTTMALVAAATIAVVVATVLTLLPALLGLAGHRIRPRRKARPEGRHEEHGRFARRFAGFLVRHRIVTACAAVLLPLLLAIPALDLRLALPTGASYDPATPQRQSYTAVSDAFGPGFNGPLLVAAHAENGALEPRQLVGVHQRLTAVDGIAGATLVGVNAADDTAVFQVVTTTGPDAEATKDVVLDLRAHADTIAGTGVEVGVTGVTAMSIDVSDRLADAMPLYLATVLLLSLVILTLVFRSILIPLQATAGFVLSVVAALGATTAVFQWGWAQGLLGLDAQTPVVSMLPIIVTGVLYGLAMDYQVFLVTSMREAHVHGADAHEAVRRGFAGASRVVAAAAVIMVSVFAGFVFNPEPMVTQIGFALAFGILVDAFLIRMVFVPATMALLRDRAWWLPRRVDKALPELDVEGGRLSELLAKSKRDAEDEPEQEAPEPVGV
ncbi:MMPL family transporter [Actinocorallia sp. API 0066]|uniref:MMPL family transporter n=1 Tax=Actinocorallia sp. API 0066 TaxID=2896846 RepID=UPI001E4FDA45|nr:MMPL family transporter [Actinocorallia sp. API 0066]MCD0451674.1 MMPL family transporter [Actinocorallia sp. API 0066]